MAISCASAGIEPRCIECVFGLAVLVGGARVVPAEGSGGSLRASPKSAWCACTAGGSANGAAGAVNFSHGVRPGTGGAC